MSAWYAQNARQLLESRQQGMTPDGQVVVSLVGGSHLGATVLHVRQEMPVDRIDWRMLVNLPVWVWANGRAPLGWLVATTARIAAARPSELVVRFEQPREVSFDFNGEKTTETIDTHDIEVGHGTHIPAVSDIPPHHAFWWGPIRLSPTHIAKGIQKALEAKHSFGTTL